MRTNSPDPSSQDQNRSSPCWRCYRDASSGFVQNRIALRDSLQLTLGTKLEHNDFSAFEWQPNARLAWNLSSTHTLWGAVSRAVRVPTRLERDVHIDLSDPTGNPQGSTPRNQMSPR